MEGKALTLSSIFDWYKEDFGKNEKEILNVLSNYANAPLRNRLQNHEGRIKYQYD